MQRTEKSLRLEKIWRHLAKSAHASVPMRTAIKAHQMPDLLPDLTVGTVTETGVTIVMAGSNVIGRFSDEITGQDYMQFIDKPQRPFMLATLQELCARPVGVCLHMESEYERGYILKLEVTLLPLLNADGTPGQAVALSVPAPDKGATLATPFLGQPVVADWGGPMCWLDLGSGVPDLGGATATA